MTALDFSAKPRTVSPLLAQVEVEEPDAADQAAGDDALEREASRVKLGPRTRPDELAPSLMEALALVESWGELEEVIWHETQHPRWPAGTPGGLGGQFMEVGQRFRLHGVDYDVAMVLRGKVYAHVATQGMAKKPGLVEFSAKDLEQAERPPAEVVKGSGPAKGETKNITATVVDAYVHSDTHDPSIAIPDGAKLSPEEWKRFGKADQERYAQLMERFGVYKAANVQGMLDSQFKQLDKDERDLLNSSYASQYGYSNVGFSLSLHGLFKGLLSLKPGSSQAETARVKYEKARAAQFELASILQWDLYNRTRSPDLAIFKGHSDNDFFTNMVTKQGVPIYAGASFSQSFRPGFFGPNKFMAPMAIRNIVMSTVSGYATPHHAFHGEQEIAMADPWVGDPSRVINAPDSSGGGYGAGGTHSPLTGTQAKWLQKMTSKGMGGALIDELRDSFADGGASLPMPPAAAEIKMDGAGGKQWVTPPAEATQLAYVGDKKTSVADLPYANVEEGHPVAMKVKDMVDAGMLHPGDYIEGMQGTRYLIVEDPSDSYLGLAYYKVTDTGAKVEGTGFKAVTGQDSSAYGGHHVWTGSAEAYQFEGGGTKAFKLLKGHYDLPSQASQSETGFHAEAWAVGGPEETKALAKFDVGQKFIVNGTPYEVTSDLAGGYKKIKNLDNGKLGQINGDYKSPFLVLKSGYTETGTASLSPDDFLQGDTATVGAQTWQPGDAFVVGQTIWQVTDPDKNGKLEAAVVGMTHTPQEHELKQFGKLHEFDKTQPVTTLTPKPPGWQPPKPGDTFAYDGARATVTKILKGGTVQAKTKAGSVKLPPNDPALAFLHTPSAWELGDTVKLKMLAPGEKFHGGTGKQQIRPYQVVGAAGTNVQVRNLDTGEVTALSGNKSYARLVVKQTAAAPQLSTVPGTPSAPPADVFDPAAWHPVGTKPIGQLEAGDKLLTADGIPFEVVDPESYKGHDDWGELRNLQTGEHVGYNKQFFAGTAGEITLLGPQDWGAKIAELAPELAQPESPYAVGQSGLDPSKLQVGDEFDVSTGGHYTVVAAEPKGDGGTWLTLHSQNQQKVLPPIEYTNSPVAGWTLTQHGKPQAAAAAATDMDAYYPAGTKMPASKAPVGTLLKSYQGDSIIQVTGKTSEGFTKWMVVAGAGAGNSNASEVTAAGPSLYVMKAKAAAATPTPTVGTGGFSKDDYIWQPVDVATLGDLKPGDVFEGQTGKHFQVKKVSGDNVYATNLDSGKQTKLAAKIKPKLLGAPKNEKLIPYDELKPGDAVLIKNLKQGDQFSFGGVDYEIAEPTHGVDEQNAVVAALVNGQPGETTNFGPSPLTAVTFKAHAGEALHAPDVLPPDPSSLPDAPYTAYSGPGVVQLFDAAPGELVEDGDGLTWTVKGHVEGTTVLSDGEQLYKLSSSATGKHLDPQDAAALTGVHGDATPALEGSSVKFGSDLAVGDKVTQPNGKTYTVSSGGLAYGDEAGDVIGINDDKVYKLATAGPQPSAPAGPTAAELVGEPDVGPSLPTASETGTAEAPIAGFLPNTLSLGNLAVNTEFVDPLHPGVVFAVDTKVGQKNITARVVLVLPSATGNDKNLQTGDMVGMDGATHTPSWIAKQGTTDAAHGGPSVGPDMLPIPASASADQDDYDWGEPVQLKNLTAGTFVKSATGSVFWISAKNDDGSAELVSADDPSIGAANAAGLTPMRPGTPHAAAVPLVTGLVDKSDYEVVGEKPVSALKVGDIYIAKTNPAWESMPHLYQVTKVGTTEMTSRQIAPEFGSPVGGVSLDSGVKVAVFAPKADAGGAPASAVLQAGDPVQPSQLVAGDHVTPGNGQEFEVVATEPAYQPPGSAPHTNITLKNVASGVQGGGYYTDTPGSPPWTFAGHPAPPEPPSAEEVAAKNVPVSGDLAYVQPDMTLAKLAGEYAVGDTIQTTGYGGGVYRVTEIVETGYQGKRAKVKVIKPGIKGTKPGATATLAAYTKALPYTGGPTWKPGEFAKVVKPGNTSGQTHVVLGYQDGKVRVVNTKGKETLADESWLQNISPTWKTTNMLNENFEVRPASMLKVGDIFKGPSAGAGAMVVDEVLPDGTVKARTWGGDPQSAYSNKTFPPTASMRTLLTARQNKSMAAHVPAAQQSAPPAPPPAPPPVAADAGPPFKLTDDWQPNDDNVTVQALLPGDRFVWGGFAMQVTGKDEVGQTLVAAIGDTGDVASGEGVKFGDQLFEPEKLWFDPASSAGHVSVPAAGGLEPDSYHNLGELGVGDVFSFGEKGAFQYEVVGKGKFSISYMSHQTGAHTSTTMGDAADTAVWFSHHATTHGPLTENDKSVNDLPAGARFVFEGTTYEILPTSEQSPDTAGTWVQPAAGGEKTTFGPEFVPQYVQLPTQGDPTKPNWVESGDVPGAHAQLSTLDVGTWFKTGGSVAGIPDAGDHVWQKTAEAVKDVPSAIYAVNEDGKKEWFGDTLDVEVSEHPAQAKMKQGLASILGDAPAPAPPAPALKVDKVPGEMVQSWDEMQPGDVIESTNGSILRVDAKKAGTSTTTDVLVDFTLLKPGSGSSLKAGKKLADIPYWSHEPPTDFKWAAAEQADVETAAAGSGGGGHPGDVLSPYLWPKSGKKKFPTIGSLQPGTKFQDKAHATYTVQGKGAAGYTHYVDEKGQEYATPDGSRVYVLDGS